MRTETSMQRTLVNVATETRRYPGHLTQSLVLTGPVRGTRFTQISLMVLPALAHGSAAAAVEPGDSELELTAALTSSDREGGVAVSLSSIQTRLTNQRSYCDVSTNQRSVLWCVDQSEASIYLSILGRYELRVTDTVVARVSVDTATMITGVLTSGALVLVLTLVSITDH